MRRAVGYRLLAAGCWLLAHGWRFVLVPDEQGRARYIDSGAPSRGSEPHARYAILEIADDGRATVEHRFVPCDPTELFRAFEERGVPERGFIIGTISRGKEPGEIASGVLACPPRAGSGRCRLRPDEP